MLPRDKVEEEKERRSRNQFAKLITFCTAADALIETF
jgi:hypothetical protein